MDKESLIEKNLKFVLVIHRKIGSNDESSSEVEQLERILYFYPQHTLANKKLNVLNMLEGLIEFSYKFSSNQINTIVMSRKVWAFRQVEPDIWMIVAIKNKLRKKFSPASVHTHQVDTFSVEDSLHHLCQMYHTLYGSISEKVVGSQNYGWPMIKQIEVLRKVERKVSIRLKQEEKDLESIQEKIETNEKTQTQSNEINKLLQTIEKTKTNIRSIQKITEALVSSKSNTLTGLRTGLSGFMNWFLCSGQFSVHSMFQGLRGVSVPPVTFSLAKNSLLVRIQHKVKSSLNGLCLGCVFMRDHRVVYSDLDPCTTEYLSEYVSLQDTSYSRSRIHDLLKHFSIDLDTYAGKMRSRRNGWKMGPTHAGRKHKESSAEIEALTQRSLRALLSKRGFITKTWEVLDLEETRVVPLLHINNFNTTGKTEELAQEVKKVDTSIDNSDYRGSIYEGSEFPAPHTGLWTEDNFFGPSETLCPRLYSTGLTLGEKKGLTGKCLGRILLFRQNRFTVAILLKDWEWTDNSLDIPENFKNDLNIDGEPPIPNLLESNTINQVQDTIQDSWGPPYKVDQVAEFLKTHVNCTDVEDKTPTTPDPIYQSRAQQYIQLIEKTPNPNHSDYKSILDDYMNSTNIGNTTKNQLSQQLSHACLITLCASLHLTLSSELYRLEKLLRRQYASSPSGLHEDMTMTENNVVPITSTSYTPEALVSVPGVIRTTVMNRSRKPSVAWSPPRVRSPGSESADSTSRNASGSFNLAVNIAGRIDNSTGKNNFQYIFHDNTNNTLIMDGWDGVNQWGTTADLNPVLATPLRFRKLLHAVLQVEGVFQSATGNRNKQDSSGNRRDGMQVVPKVFNSLITSLADKTVFPFPTTNAQYSLGLDPALLRAMNDIWTQLQFPDENIRFLSGIERKVKSRVSEACVRVSTASKGGVWVVGRRSACQKKVLLMTVEKCATINDVCDIFEHLCDQLKC